MQGGLELLATQHTRTLAVTAAALIVKELMVSHRKVWLKVHPGMMIQS